MSSINEQVVDSKVMQAVANQTQPEPTKPVLIKAGSRNHASLVINEANVDLDEGCVLLPSGTIKRLYWLNPPGHPEEGTRTLVTNEEVTRRLIAWCRQQSGKFTPKQVAVALKLPRGNPIGFIMKKLSQTCLNTMGDGVWWYQE